MTSPEFELIKKYFSDLDSGFRDPQQDASNQTLKLGIGDDCALISPPTGMLIASSMDTLVSGRHFLPDTDPFRLGYKALAVNLSDLAAMGATPAWAMLSLTLPDIDHPWLSGFSKGFAQLAREFRVALIGGDTTRGPLSISIQVQGTVEPQKVLTRGGAGIGDQVVVSGTLGDAGLGLLQLQGRQSGSDENSAPVDRLEQPEPRVKLGREIAGLASAAIDISDGLLADLGHICERSNVEAQIYIDRIPCSGPVSNYTRATGDQLFPLTAGDDYELCFTMPLDQLTKIAPLGQELGLRLTVIGEIVAGSGEVRVMDGQGRSIGGIEAGGYDHFR